jgi:hypothetical protein
MCCCAMQEEALLGNFVRLVDYVCSEAVMARVTDNVADIAAQLRAGRAADKARSAPARCSVDAACLSWLVIVVLLHPLCTNVCDMF